MTRLRPNLTLLATVWLAASLVFFAAEAIAAASVPLPRGYSYAADLISQLGVRAWTPLAAVMNTGFCLQGVLFLAGAVLAVRNSASGPRRLFIVLVAMNALGDVLVAMFHGDALANGNNGAAALHWWGALLAILGGNAAILAGSSVVAGLVNRRWYRTVSIVLAVVGILSLLMVGHPAARGHAGIFERGSVYSIMLWQLFSAVLLIARRRADIARSVAR